jgi:NAD(P)-dependent dehydrogenase (short-subunit alcohol dehydrogenase family)
MKVLWITGASSGIGEAVAREWVARGGNVALSARRVDRLEKLATELGGPSRAIAMPCDVTQEQDCEHAAQKVAAHFGGIDCVFANAGFGVSGEVELLKIADFERQFETNVYGVVRTALAALPHLRKTQGAFAITGSVMSHLSMAGGAPYAMSKFAVRALADSLRGEWRRYGLSVTLISPGFVASEIRLVDNEGKLKEHSQDPVPSWLVMPAAQAAREIVSAIRKRKPEQVITGHGKVLVWLNRFFPWFLHSFLLPKFATPPGRKGWTE